MTGKTTHKQDAAIVELLKGKQFDEVAEIVGVTERTLNRWWSDAAFRVRYYQEQTAKIDAALVAFLEDIPVARAALLNVIANPQQRGATNRRMAAKDLLDVILRLRDRTVDLRLTELEDQFYGKQD